MLWNLKKNSIKIKWQSQQSESNHDYRVKINVIDYITITCNLKNGQLQITSDYMKKCNRLQLITITNYDYPMFFRKKTITPPSS
jgi:hypothetical protein